MATFKALVLPSNRKSDGTYNVKIRVTHKRVTRYISTPFYVEQSQLTRGYKIKDQLVLDKVESEIKRMRDKTYEIGFVANNLDVDQLIARINLEQNSVCFTGYMKHKLDELATIESRISTSSTYNTALNSLLRYNNGKQLLFSQMTKAYILDYYKYLLSRTKVITANTYISIIKTFYNMARKELNDEESDIIVVKYRCFDAIEFEKEEYIPPRSFEKVEEMQAIIDCPYNGTWLFDLSKDMFVFSFVCFGINPADIFRLKHENYKDGILTYRRKKIERRAGEKSEIKIKVPEAGRIIIEKYSGDNEYLISFKDHSRHIDYLRAIHKVFQNSGVECNCSGNKSKYVFYSARHSMATFARNICKIDKETVHEMLNHTTSKEFAITDVYIRKDYSHLWEANDKLMALFDWSFYLKQKKVHE